MMVSKKNLFGRPYYEVHPSVRPAPGKRANEVSMADDQAYILTQIIRIIDAEQPDAVVIAGEVYGKSVSPAEAVTLFDAFLCPERAGDPPVRHRRPNCESKELSMGGSDNVDVSVFDGFDYVALGHNHPLIVLQATS